MKKSFTIIVLSIYSTFLIFGLSCTKEHDDIMIPEDTDCEFHVQTRVGTTYCTICGLSLDSYPHDFNCNGPGLLTYCSMCGQPTTAGHCFHGCDQTYSGSYHCSSCKSNNIERPSYGYAGSCNNCGSDPNWGGLELCSGIPCSKCYASESGSNKGLVDILGLFDSDSITQLLEQWLQEGGMEVILYTTTPQIAAYILDAIQDGDIVAIENAIPYGSNGIIGEALINWLHAQGY